MSDMVSVGQEVGDRAMHVKMRNGATARTSASGGIVTTTTPGGRTITANIDSQGRPTSIAPELVWGRTTVGV